MKDKPETRTVEELRQLARRRGLSGYSKMRKPELLRLLPADDKPAASAMPGKKQKTAGPAKKPSGSALKREITNKPAAAVSTRPSTTVDDAPAEQRVESSKYALIPPGQFPFQQSFAADLGENLEHLPSASEPVICLLPQKPGLLHAYWALPPPLPAPLGELRLRLGRLAAEGVEIVEEIGLSSARGHWYFHVPDSVSSGDYYLHLGSYRDKNFVTAIRRGIARAPRLFASAEIDRRWWIDDDRFREMYLRAGGVLRLGRLAWPGSASSPGGAGDSTTFSRRKG
ncbi:MAG: hypothetical protein AABY62_06425 [Pseudomonadota bacterium]